MSIQIYRMSATSNSRFHGIVFGKIYLRWFWRNIGAVYQPWWCSATFDGDRFGIEFPALRSDIGYMVRSSRIFFSLWSCVLRHVVHASVCKRGSWKFSCQYEVVLLEINSPDPRWDTVPKPVSTITTRNQWMQCISARFRKQPKLDIQSYPSSEHRVNCVMGECLSDNNCVPASLLHDHGLEY